MSGDDSSTSIKKSLTDVQIRIEEAKKKRRDVSFIYHTYLICSFFKNSSSIMNLNFIGLSLGTTAYRASSGSGQQNQTFGYDFRSLRMRTATFWRKLHARTHFKSD